MEDEENFAKTVHPAHLLLSIGIGLPGGGSYCSRLPGREFSGFFGTSLDLHYRYLESQIMGWRYWGDVLGWYRYYSDGLCHYPLDGLNDGNVPLLMFSTSF